MPPDPNMIAKPEGSFLRLLERLRDAARKAERE
jgi:hypothetical protein